MSDFLALCKDLRRECRIPGSGPTAVTNQVGQMADVVEWVKKAYTRLQQEQPNWRWLRGNFTLQTIADTDKYAFDHANLTDADTGVAISRWAKWWTEEFQIYLTSAGIGTRRYIPYVRWELHRQVWHTGNPNASNPSEVSIDPQNRLRLGAKPDGIYTLTGEYQKGPQILAADGDVPEMPSRFHDLIVAMAMKSYAASEAAPEVFAEANRIEAYYRPLLQVDQMPVPRFDGPLA